MLRLIANDEYTIELDDQVTIPVNYGSPLLTSILGYSFPFSFPVTDRNEKYFGYPFRLHGFAHKKNQFRLKIEFGVFVMAGLCTFENIGEGERYEATFTTDEGALFEELENTMLSELDFGGVKLIVDPSPSFSLNTRIIDYYSSLKGKVWPDAEYNLIPVKVPMHNEEKYISDPRVTGMINDWDYDTQKFIKRVHPLGRRIITPITPFLFMNTVIDYLFKTFNIQIARNDLAKSYEACRTLLFPYYIQTDADPYLEFEKLVPQCTVKEFLIAVEDKFNCTCYINYAKREVSIISNDTALNSIDVLDITHLAGNEITLERKTFDSVVMKASPAPGNLTAGSKSYEEFVTEFGEPVEISSEVLLPDESGLGVADEGKLYYSKATGLFHRVEVIEATEEEDIYGYAKISSDLFTYEQDGDNNLEIDNTTVPQTEYVKVVTDEIYGFYYSVLRARTDVLWRVPKSVRRAYGENPSQDNYPITFAYYYYAQPPGSLGYMPNFYPQGIVTPLDASGLPTAYYKHSLKYHGYLALQDTLRKNFINFIKHSGQPIELELYHTPEDLMNFRWWRQYRIKEENYLVESMQIVLSLFEFKVEIARLCPVKLKLTHDRELRKNIAFI